MEAHAVPELTDRDASMGRAAKIPRAIKFFAEAAVAALLLFEVGILLVGVTARYVFNKPLPWTDELASSLFLWVAMLGAVIAVERMQHMRIMLFVRRAAPGTRFKLEALASLSASGAMSETIPPSLVLITTGVATGVSIEALFTAGLVPALVMALALSAVIWWRSQKEAKADVAPPTMRRLGAAALVAVPGIGLPIIIRTAVVEGVATATEVSTIGIVYCVIVALILYRPFPWRRIAPMLVETASLSGAILFIVGAATAMAWALTQSGFSTVLAAAITGLPGGQFTFFVVSIVFFIALGSLLEGLPAILIFGPMLFPVAATLGINTVHYAIVVVLAMGIGLFIPPFGIGYWAACVIAQVDADEGVRPLVPYVIALIVGVSAIAAIPSLSTGFLK